jgi:hypothetical protein
LFGLYNLLNIFCSMYIDNEFRSCHVCVCVHAGISLCVSGSQKHTNIQNYVYIHGQAANSRSKSKAELLQGMIYTIFRNSILGINTDYFSNRHYPLCRIIEKNRVLYAVRTESSHTTELKLTALFTKYT